MLCPLEMLHRTLRRKSRHFPTYLYFTDVLDVDRLVVSVTCRLPIFFLFFHFELQTRTDDFCHLWSNLLSIDRPLSSRKRMKARNETHSFFWIDKLPLFFADKGQYFSSRFVRSCRLTGLLQNVDVFLPFQLGFHQSDLIFVERCCCVYLGRHLGAPIHRIKPVINQVWSNKLAFWRQSNTLADGMINRVCTLAILVGNWTGIWNSCRWNWRSTLIVKEKVIKIEHVN